MNDKVVIAGHVKLKNTIKAKTNLHNTINGTPSWVVNTGGGSQPTGTKSILLTEAGTLTENVSAYASAEINAVTDASASGAVASFSDGAEDVPMDSCVVNIEPVQDLHGQDAPYPPGGGKNLLNPTGETVTTNGITFTMNSDGTVVASGTATAQAVFTYSVTEYQSSLSGDYVLNGNPTGASSSTYRMRIRSFSGSAWGSWIYANSTEDRSVILTNATKIEVHIIVLSGQTISNLVFKPMVRLASITDGTYAPYSNICPISGWSTVNVYVSPTLSAQDATVHTISLGQTVYGGTLDVVTGVLTVDMAMVDLGTLTWGKTTGGSSNDRYFSQSLNTVIKKPSTNNVVANISCEEFVAASANNGFAGNVKNSITIDTAGTVSIYPTTNYTDASTFKTAMSGVKLVYELATPTTVQLTPTEVTTLLGSNSVWADSGDIAVEYKADVYLSGIPHYDGSYTVTPSTTAQVLETDGMVMDNDVTIQAVPQGSATTPITIMSANPTISVSSGGLITATVSSTTQITPTVQEGYVSQGTPGNVAASGSATQQLTTLGAQTIHPSTVDWTIPANRYTTGVQTFKAVTVSGLTADKVLQGTTVEIGDSDDSDRIMKVVGTAQGGGSGLVTVASGTFTGANNNPTNAGTGFSVGKKMPKTDFVFRIIAQPDSEFPYDTYYKYTWGIAVIDSDIAEFDLSSAGTGKQPVSVKSVKVNNSGTVSNVDNGSYVLDMGNIRNASSSYFRPNNFRIDMYSDRFEIRLYHSNASYLYANGVKYDWEIIYFGSNPSTDIVDLS